jgi:RimJ/RimL family protein N-acetyltransferase
MEERDAPDLHLIMNDPEVTANLLVSPPCPEDEVARWIESSREALERKEHYRMAIVLAPAGPTIGVCSLERVSWQHMNAELIYWLGKPYWGKGYTTEAAARMIKFGFEELGLERISVGCFARNKASARVIEKLGFKYEGCHRHKFLKNGEFQDELRFGLIREEYPG